LLLRLQARSLEGLAVLDDGSDACPRWQEVEPTLEWRAFFAAQEASRSSICWTMSYRKENDRSESGRKREFALLERVEAHAWV
jgi:hypothetical protein